MTSNNLLSVIVAAYNEEKYVGACIDSLLRQPYRPLEIIVVDDGSTDATPEVLTRYASIPEVKLITRPNGGLSVARNTGLDKAKGDFIAFIDSDDEIAEDTFVTNMPLLASDNQLDMVQFPMMFGWLSENQHLFKPKAEIYTSKAKIFEKCFRGVANNSVCNKIFRKSVFAEKRFEAGILYEDMSLSCELAMIYRKIAISETGVYLYRHNPKSILGVKSNPRRAKDYLKAKIKWYHQCSVYPSLKLMRERFWIKSLRDRDIRNMGEYSQADQKEIFELIHSISPSTGLLLLNVCLFKAGWSIFATGMRLRRKSYRL